MCKIIFMGTPEIAVPTLELLHKKYGVECVVTVPDMPIGRGLKVGASPIKDKANELNIEVLQPQSLRDDNFINRLKEIKPDIIIVFAFRVLPKEVYQISNIATFNIHTSLLPDYRGAAPINWAIINGDIITGLTSFILDEKVDTGKILLQQEVIIPHNSTAGELHDIMQSTAPAFAVETCEALISKNYTLLAQPTYYYSVAPKLFKKDAKINWNSDAVSVTNFINGYSPTPCAWSSLNKATIKIYKACVPAANNFDSREIYSLDSSGQFLIKDNRLVVQCGIGIVEILELQIEGKKKMDAMDFLNGYRGKSTGKLA